MYRLDSGIEESWRVCRILDISPMGAGLQLFQLLPDEQLEGNITISFELRGEGRDVIRSDDGTTARFGIEFAELNESAKQYLKLVSDEHW